MLTPREFRERENVYEAYMARQAKLLAVIANAPHFHKTDKSAYTALDFMDSPRAVRARDELQRKTMKEKLELLALERELAEPIDKAELPAWALPEFHRHGGRNNGR